MDIGWAAEPQVERGNLEVQGIPRFLRPTSLSLTPRTPLAHPESSRREYPMIASPYRRLAVLFLGGIMCTAFFSIIQSTFSTTPSRVLRKNMDSKSGPSHATPPPPRARPVQGPDQAHALGSRAKWIKLTRGSRLIRSTASPPAHHRKRRQRPSVGNFYVCRIDQGLPCENQRSLSLQSRATSESRCCLGCATP